MKASINHHRGHSTSIVISILIILPFLLLLRISKFDSPTTKLIVSLLSQQSTTTTTAATLNLTLATSNDDRQQYDKNDDSDSDDDDDHNDDDDNMNEVKVAKKKRNFVFHIGPPKTATTTIQEFMTQLRDEGRLSSIHNNDTNGNHDNDNLLDKYVYLGTYHTRNDSKPSSSRLKSLLTSTRCYIAMNEVRRQYNKEPKNNSDSLRDTILQKVKCARRIMNEINLYPNGTDFLLSDETITLHRPNAWQYWHPGMDQYETSIDWISLVELLSLEWDITVIFGYRRYMDWMVSAKQQMERWTLTKPRLNHWPGDGGHGKIIEPLLPHYWKQVGTPGVTNVSVMAYQYTDTVWNSIEQVNEYYTYRNENSNRINTVIFNLHETKIQSKTNAFYNNDINDPVVDDRGTTATAKELPIRTNFLCNALPDAYHSCHYSIMLDQQGLKEPKSNQYQSNDYDQLVASAAMIQLLYIDSSDSKYKHLRHPIVVAAQKYHQRLIQLSFTASTSDANIDIINYTNIIERMFDDNNNTDYYYNATNQTNVNKFEFPLLCPSDEDMNEFLQKSLDYEKSILPNHSIIYKEQHMQYFWDHKYKFCSIDTNVAFQTQDHWIYFFKTVVPYLIKNKYDQLMSYTER